jgi:hypothetical protein
MVRELGWDSAEAWLKGAAQVIAPKADAANTIGVKCFMEKVSGFGETSSP